MGQIDDRRAIVVLELEADLLMFRCSLSLHVTPASTPISGGRQ
jgi:hypothetical protein